MKDWRKLKSPSQLYVKNPLIFHSFFLSLSLSLSCFISRSLPLSKFFTCFDATAYTRVSRYDDIPLFCGLMMMMMMLYKGNLRRINTTLSHLLDFLSFVPNHHHHFLSFKVVFIISIYPYAHKQIDAPFACLTRTLLCID